MNCIWYYLFSLDMLPSLCVSSDYPATLRMHPASRELVMSAKGQTHRVPRSLWVSSFRTERAKSSRSLQFLTNPIDFSAKGSWGELLAPQKSTATFLAVARPRVLPFLLVWCTPLCSVMKAVNLWEQLCWYCSYAKSLLLPSHYFYNYLSWTETSKQ